MNGTTTASSSSSSHIDSPAQALPFDPTHCLFCTSTHASLSLNLTHMRLSHSFSIPSSSNLLVDIPTLLSYLHLIIATDFQCLSCGVEHRSVEAAKHHMTAKGHCGFEIEGAGLAAELREFYDFDCDSGEEEEEDEDEDEDGSGNEVEMEDGQEDRENEGESPEDQRATMVQIDENSLRMASRKVISHRSARPSRPGHKSLRPTISSQTTTTDSDLPNGPSSPTRPNSPSPSSPPPNIPSALSHRATKALAHHKTALSYSRASDRQHLMRLPASQQRALLATQEKQMARAVKQERNMRGRVEGKGNKVLMGHFRADCPGGRTNG